MKDFISITIPSHPKYLSVVRDITTKFGELNGLDESVLNDIKLAVDEACTNVIKHAYRGDTTKKILITYEVKPQTFKAVIEDSGIRAQKNLIKGRSLNDIRPGGLGIHFIRRVFDTFTFDDSKKKGNRLILIKHMKGKG